MRTRLTLLVLSAFLLTSCMHSNMSSMSHGAVGGIFLPAKDAVLADLPDAKPSETLVVNDGATIDLNPTIVRKTIAGVAFPFYAYNGQFPGPHIVAMQESTFTVNVRNDIDLPTSVHWHGIRLANANDGAVGTTQKAIEPGASYSYTVHVPDAGVFWYHPHVREDIEQDMGLYGVIEVLPKHSSPSDADRTHIITLDDILLDDGRPVPYGTREADFALMGRFGNTLLVDGALPKAVEVPLGGIDRFTFVNAASTRTFRIVRLEGSMLKLVGGDSGENVREKLVDAVTISPSERVTVELFAWDDGVNRGTPQTRTVPFVVAGNPQDPETVLPLTIIGGIVADNRSDAFREERAHADVQREIEDLRSLFDRPVDETLHLTVEQAMMGNMGHGGMMHGEVSDDGIEWEDPMPMMNAMATGGNTTWKLVDEKTGKANMDIRYAFAKGDYVKIRIVNDTADEGSDHPMQHPIHFHGQRFLVLRDDGVENTNLAWEDTVLVGAGHTVDILLDASNPGDWMMHCHIAEHLTAGMMGQFSVK